MSTFDEKTLQAWMSRFVDWMKPDERIEEEIRRQAEEIRKRITMLANQDGRRVKETPSAGSFAKNTGLRRHMDGGSEVEGLDVDIPIVMEAKTQSGQELTELQTLIAPFQRYANEAFKDQKVRTGNYAVHIDFQGARRTYDLVPMLFTGVPNQQILMPKEGGIVKTSVGEHVEFIVKRTRYSNALAGRCKFNECVRLMKWWRSRHINHNAKTSSFVLELLCAHAYDTHQVGLTYAETLALWFEHIARVVKNREMVVFGPARGSAPAHGWRVIDPCNPDNNLVLHWTEQRINTLANVLSEGEKLARELRDEARRGREDAVRRCCNELLGPAFKTHAINAITSR